MKQSLPDFIRDDCERVFKESPSTLEELNQSSVLITGGSGFMGSWILETIQYLNEKFNKGIEVHVISRNREKYIAALPHIARMPNVNIIRSDVRTVSELPRNINYVIHAAANPDNRMHSSRPLETVCSISDGTSSLIRAVDRVSNLKMFVNMSSGNIYGKQPENFVKIPETFTGAISPTDLNNVYAEAKRFSESLITAARSELRLPVINLRPFSFLGPYQAPDAPWAANTFINDAIHGRSIRILGDGETVRTVMYGADLALWVLVIMTKGKTGSVYNMGSDDGRKLHDLAHMVAAHFSPKPDVLLNTSLAGNIANSIMVPDIDKAKNDFNLRIFTDTKKSVLRTIEWNKIKVS